MPKNIFIIDPRRSLYLTDPDSLNPISIYTTYYKELETRAGIGGQYI